MNRRISFGMLHGMAVGVAVVFACAGTVSAAASDENAGTEAAPFKTINGAAARVKPGDLVIVRPGVYRETVVTKIGGEGEGSRVTFRAEPKHQAIVDGADVITGFEAVADRPGVYLRKNATPMWPRFVAKEWAATAFSTCREQTYVDGQLLRQALRMDDLQPGTFFVDVHGDHGPRNLYVQLESNGDPNQHRVEYTTRQRLWECPAPYVTIEGFVLQHALTNRHPSAAVLPGRHALLADNVIQWTNGHGVAIRATARYRGNILQHNGSLGGAGGGENVLFEGNVVRHNNWRRFGTGIYGWEEGGVKFVGLRSSTVRGNDVYRNDGSGLWFDMRCGDVIVENNRCHHNQPFAAYKGYTSGIVVEISRNFVIRNNLCFNNGQQQWAAAGITLAYSYDCRVVNNTCYGNRFGIAVQEHRLLTSPERFDPPIDFSGDIGDPRTRHTPPPCYDTIENNLCFDNEEAQFAMRFADESFRPQMCSRMGFVFRRNLYWDGRNDAPAMAVWGLEGKPGRVAFKSLDDWRKATGQEADSIWADPRCVDAKGGDFRLRKDSPAQGFGADVESIPTGGPEVGNSSSKRDGVR